MNAENFTRIVTGIIALVIVVGVFVLIGFSIVIPEGLWAGFALVLGFFFGNQIGEARARAR